MNARKSMAWVGSVALILAGFLGTSVIARALDKPDSEEVSKLLSEAKTMAFQVKEDAETMESFTRTNVSWQSHASAIAQIKEHINSLSGQVDKLKAVRNSASPWLRAWKTASSIATASRW
jgi:uncharacterized phage-associated protein